MIVSFCAVAMDTDLGQRWRLTVGICIQHAFAYLSAHVITTFHAYHLFHNYGIYTSILFRGTVNKPLFVVPSWGSVARNCHNLTKRTSSCLTPVRYYHVDLKFNDFEALIHSYFSHMILQKEARGFIFPSLFPELSICFSSARRLYLFVLDHG